jgi:hypothetical protein
LIVTLGLLTDEVFQIENDLEAYLSETADGAITIPADLAGDGLAAYVPLHVNIDSKRRSTGDHDAILHLRNTDPAQALRINRIRAYDATGKERASLIDAPLNLGPMATTQLQLSGLDGLEVRPLSSAIVEWSSAGAVNPPIFEASIKGPGGVIFLSRGEPIGRH